MITIHPPTFRKLQYLTPATKEPFYVGPGTPSGSTLMYRVINPVREPIYIQKMEIINAHPNQEPFRPNTFFKIYKLDGARNITSPLNSTFLDFMPIIEPFNDIHCREEYFLINVDKPTYFVLHYSYVLDKNDLIKKIKP